MAKRRRRRKKGRMKALIAVEAAVMLALIIVLFVIWKLDLADTGNKKSVIEATLNDEVQAQIEDDDNGWNMSGYTNVALFGVDSRDGNLDKGARTDTIIIASLNEKTGDIKICSVFRDTYLNIGNDTYNKANSAYSHGGPDQAVQMLNTNMDLDIDQYITVDFKALVDTIDALGGVEVDVTEEEISFLNDYQIGTAEETGDTIINVKNAGLQTLNGLQATSYCRIRYTKGDDFKRAERQRTVLMQVAEKLKAASVTEINDVIDVVFPEIKTSFSKDELVAYAAKAAGFTVTAQSGFPADNSTGTMGDAGSCVVANDFAANVEALHEFLYGDSEYSPSSTVEDISSKISSDKTRYGV
ncbi:MAG: LCP family protein [Lachnospiraceae bacterium]|nr:LCP family protein [Lachnospiraceae bacterium]